MRRFPKEHRKRGTTDGVKSKLISAKEPCASLMTDADIAQVRKEFLDELSRLASESDFQTLRDKYLGRKNGLITGLMKSVAAAPPDRKPVE